MEDKSSDDADIAELDRRNFLKAVGAGVSLSAIDFLGEEEAQIGDITYNPQKEVAYVSKVHHEIDSELNVRSTPIYDKMDKEKWRKQRVTDTALEKIRTDLNKLDSPIEDLSVIIRGDGTSSTEERLDLIIDKSSSLSVQKVEEYLPNEISLETDEREWNVPVGIEEQTTGDTSCTGSCTYRGEMYDGIAGGAPILSDEMGTITAPYLHPDHGFGWITAAHVVAENTGESVWEQGDDASGDTDYIGVSKEIDVAFGDDGDDYDVAFIEIDSSNNFTKEWIAKSDYSDNEDIPIDGIVTNQELRNHIDDADYVLNQQGQTTCRQGTYVTGIRETTLGEMYGVETSGAADAEDGDSGGPLFHIDNNDNCGDSNDLAYVAGMIKGNIYESEDQENVIGVLHNPAETIENRFGGDFMV